MKKAPAYNIRTDSFGKALVQLVKVFEAENPSVGTFRAKLLCGAKVTIDLNRPAGRKAKAPPDGAMK